MSVVRPHRPAAARAASAARALALREVEAGVADALGRFADAFEDEALSSRAPARIPACAALAAAIVPEGAPRAAVRSLAACVGSFLSYAYLRRRAADASASALAEAAGLVPAAAGARLRSALGNASASVARVREPREAAAAVDALLAALARARAVGGGVRDRTARAQWELLARCIEASEIP